MQFKYENVLITGVDGFIGSQPVELLIHAALGIGSMHYLLRVY
jgi:nucleoside-diphosphate-sugar epimerase